MFTGSFIGGMIKLFPFMAGVVEVKVSSETLYNAAIQAQNVAQQIRARFECIQQTVNSTHSYWNGEVSDKERGEIREEYDEMMNYIKMLTMYSESLKQMARNYETTEGLNEEQAQGLPTGIIT